MHILYNKNNNQRPNRVSKPIFIDSIHCKSSIKKNNNKYYSKQINECVFYLLIEYIHKLPISKGEILF